MAAHDDGNSLARNPLLAHVAVAALDAILHPLPPRGFSSIAIPLPSTPSSLYLNALGAAAAPADADADELDEPLPQEPPSRATSSSSLRRRFQLAAPPEPKGAYTILCVDASRVQRTVGGFLSFLPPPLVSLPFLFLFPKCPSFCLALPPPNHRESPSANHTHPPRL